MGGEKIKGKDNPLPPLVPLFSFLFGHGKVDYILIIFAMFKKEQERDDKESKGIDVPEIKGLFHYSYQLFPFSILW